VCTCGLQARRRNEELIRQAEERKREAERRRREEEARRDEEDRRQKEAEMNARLAVSCFPLFVSFLSLSSAPCCRS
jgi:hypothetical protein